MKNLFFIFVFFILSTFLAAIIINVPAEQPTIQAGIDAAADTDTVLVADGTYFENIDFIGKAITVTSNFLIDADTLHIENTIINGSQSTNPDYGSVVTFASNEDNASVISGFTLTEGSGTFVDTYWEYGGGGIFCDGSAPTIQYNKISENAANNAGGIAVLYASQAVIKYNTIFENSANVTPGSIGGGGGIAVAFDSNPEISHNDIHNNFSNKAGGGIACGFDCNPEIKNNSIINNVANDYGGGFQIYSNTAGIFENNIIMGNSSLGANGAGGISCRLGSTPVIANNLIIDNSTITYGGGIRCFDDAAPTIINNLIIGNEADISGGGIACDNGASATIINCTISGNTSSENGGGIYCNTVSDITLVNTIVEGNTGVEGAGVYFDQYGNLDIQFCDFYNGIDNFGGNVPPDLGIITTVNANGDPCDDYYNIFEDPLFTETGDDPYSLLEISPCIDAGIPDTTGLNLPLWDIIGNLRIWDGDGDGIAIIDMGAYEYGAPPYVDADDCQFPIVDFQLYNYPNPFNPETTISFSLTAEDAENAETCPPWRIVIFNLKGQKVKTLPIVTPSPGYTLSVTWNGTDDNNKPVSSGIYFYKLKTGNFEKTKKMILLK